MAFQAESDVHFPISTGRDKFRHLSFPFDSLQRRPRHNSIFILFDSGEEVLGITVASKSGVRQARYLEVGFLRAGGRFSEGRKKFSYGEKNSGSISRCSCGCRHASAQCEPLTMVAVRCLGTITLAFADSQGNLQVNASKPVMLHNALTSIELLTDASRSFLIVGAIGIEPNKKHIREHLGNCLMLVTALNPNIGYEKTAKISPTARRCHAGGRPLRSGPWWHPVPG